MYARVTLHHDAHEILHLHRIKDTKRIGQHEATDTNTLQAIHELEHIVWRILHAITPILKIHVYRHTFFCSIGNRAAYVCNMLFGSTLKLFNTVLERTFREKIHHTSTTPENPIHRGGTIDEAEDLDLLDMSCTLCPVANSLYRLSFTCRHTCRGHLDTIHPEVIKQATRYGKFLVGHERYATGLFAITQRSIHYLYLTICHSQSFT